MTLSRFFAEALARRVIPLSERREADVAIGGRVDPYLLRWFVIPRNKWFGIYLHNMLRDDDDRALHDHPKFNISIVLRGGFYEEMPRDPFDPTGPTEKVFRRPGDIVFRRPSAPHRLELPMPQPTYLPSSWSLFITGPAVREWGFWCKNRGWVPWQVFIGAPEGTSSNAVDYSRPRDETRGCD